MNTALARIFRLHDGEAAPVFIMGAVLFLNAVAMQISGVLSVSGFLDNVGTPGILVVWILDFGVILAMSAMQALVIDRIERIRLVRIILAAFLIATIGLRLLFASGASDTLGYLLLYLLKDQQWLFLPAVFWVLANDVFSMSQGKRIFPVIAAFGLVGKLVGVSLSIFLPGLMHAQLHRPIADILWINAALYVVAGIVLTTGLRRRATQKPSTDKVDVRDALSEGFNFIRTVPMFRFLTIAILLLVVCETVIEFEFLSRADRSYDTLQNFAQFYATFRLITIMATILIESMVTSRVIDKLQIKNTFLVLPVTVLITSCGLLVQPGATTAIGVMLTAQIAKNVDDAAARSLRALVPEDKRGRVTLFMENYLIAAGTIGGSILIGALLLANYWLQLGDPAPLYLVLCIAAAAAAVVAVLRMRAQYENSLLNWKLTRRKRASSLLDKLDI